ncbi:MAG: hypothetical protein UH734_04090 [Ruminococcus sp.]|nr:hypothetical protein [Ruminococcus sp.]
MKTGSDKRLIMTKNLIMMFVILAVLLMAIFAWYSNNDTVTASGSTISAKAADEVELALPNNDGSFPLSNDAWSTEISFLESPYCLKDLVKDVTSGGKQFVIPTFEAAKGLRVGRTVIRDDVWTEGLSSKKALITQSTLDDDQYNYISFDFYIRSKNQNINITPASFLAAGSELGIDENGQINENNPQTKLLTGNDIYRCSSYGAQKGKDDAFSSDAIVGAMRVSLEGCLVDGVSTNNGVTSETSYDGGNWNTKSDLRFLWLPRPDVYLSTDDNSNNWKLFTGIKPTGNVLAAETYCHKFYEGKEITGGVKKGLIPHTYSDKTVKLVDGSDLNIPSCFKVSDTRNDTQLGNIGHYPTLGQSVKITGEPAQSHLDTSKQIQFTTKQGDNREPTGYYVYKYTLNIWIEGEDAEARRSMNNGVFSLELDFGT